MKASEWQGLSDACSAPAAALGVPVLGGRVLGPPWGHDLHPTTSVQLEVT